VEEMGTATIERINQLAAERHELFRQATNGHRGDPVMLRRVREIVAELEQLWGERRVELAGHREAIDLLIDRAYEQAYGRGYEDIVTPPRVETVDEERRALIAA